MAGRRALLWLVACALVFAQAIGLMHSVMHAPGTMPSAAARAMYVDASNASVDRTGQGWLKALFSGHDDDSTCRLFDQLGHGDAAPSVAAVQLPLTVPTFLLLAFQGDFVARWAALFDARGPPSVR